MPTPIKKVTPIVMPKLTPISDIVKALKEKNVGPSFGPTKILNPKVQPIKVQYDHGAEKARRKKEQKRNALLRQISKIDQKLK